MHRSLTKSLDQILTDISIKFTYSSFYFNIWLLSFLYTRLSTSRLLRASREHGGGAFWESLPSITASSYVGSENQILYWELILYHLFWLCLAAMWVLFQHNIWYGSVNNPHNWTVLRTVTSLAEWGKGEVRRLQSIPLVSKCITPF